MPNSLDTSLGNGTSRPEKAANGDAQQQDASPFPSKMPTTDGMKHSNGGDAYHENADDPSQATCRPKNNHAYSSSSSSSALPLIALAAGIQKKASVTELSSWVSLALTLDGRDKITKVFQYAARLLAWWLAGSGSNHAERFAALKTSLTNSRKAFRLGRTGIEFHKLQSMGIVNGILQYFQSSVGKETKVQPLWKLLGTALKMLGLAGFWAGDNVNFLALSGFLDNYSSSITGSARMEQRKALQTSSSIFANRCYFAGAVAGLVVGWKSILEFRRETLRPLHDRLDQLLQSRRQDDKVDDKGSAITSLQNEIAKAKEQYFVLVVAFVKSCCDVLVFSNNPGLDLWQKYRGKKMHEGFHCLCGLTSASSVLYNNFPDQKKLSTTSSK